MAQRRVYAKTVPEKVSNRGGTIGPGTRPGRQPELHTLNNRTLRHWCHGSGMTPAEFLVRLMRGEKVLGMKATPEQRIECARAAAQFFTPKLKQVKIEEHEEVDRHIIFDASALEALNHEELSVFLRVFNFISGKEKADILAKKRVEAAETASTTNRYQRELSEHARKKLSNFDK